MTSKTLVILFGHENTLDGQISLVAISRCDCAIDVFNKNEGAYILPTGGFGSHFNQTDIPHTSYLSEYLISKGVPKERIMSGTRSSNTLEDCLCARKIAIDSGFSDVIAVTSTYHLDRVRYIFEQIFMGIIFSFNEAPTPSNYLPRLEKQERASFDKLKREWVDAPLYENGKEFPLGVYDATANDQRHYDTISLATVTAMIIITGSVIILSPDTFVEISKVVTLWAVALLILLLLGVYERTAQSARVARRIMRIIEIGFDARGFSASYDPKRIFKWWCPEIRSVVLTLGLSIFAALVIMGILVAVGCLE